MFRGKESSNRIQLSRLVQRVIEIWCFGLPVALRRGQVGGAGGSGGIWRHGGVCPHTHAHAYAYARTRTCTHIYTCIEIANGL